MDTETITEPSETCRCAQDPRTAWSSPRKLPDPVRIAHVLGAALQGVMRFDERWPVKIDVFGADSPCDACFWEA